MLGNLVDAKQRKIEAIFFVQLQINQIMIQMAYIAGTFDKNITP